MAGIGTLDELLACTIHGAWEELVDRLLVAPQRKGRTLLGLRLGALFGDGGSWSVAQGLGRPIASARALRAVLLLLPVDASSRVPERRDMLTPFPASSR